MGSSLGRSPQTFDALLQRMQDQIRRLEAARSYSLGGWLLQQTTDGRVVLSHPETGTEVELAGTPPAQ
ncbi:hypothetical protein QRX50_31660 [Amycolatopsis carbonis]|uniref:Uncharacterized protein n=1 Tax=Amycolatopsis carbonis TaxID=715471 RepID=A0A9Y2MUT3_9PSEU|nr:hypothetical protein [Amycolatopsis sp. 2-15]WIX76017.1 hypothetical protein QRX50_31660 [Amycolatopsis sp. 2-15]